MTSLLICNEEEAPKKMKKSVLEPSNNTTQHMDIIVDQAIGMHFQEGIIIEILSRLPVRSLHRFKCVSKFWKALITDSYFKMKHLNRAKDDQNFQKILVSKRCLDKNSSDKITHFYSSSLSSVQLVEDEKELDFPPNWTPSTLILSSCDGLVLIRCFDLRIDKQILLLWNPSTRESIELPLPRRLPLEFCVCGMGYDTTCDDYKIIMINLGGRFSRAEISTEIVALKSGSWRSCEYPTGIRRVHGIWDSGMDYFAIVHGAFHWIGGLSRYYIIVSFNISNEVYGEIPLLEQMCHNFERKKLTDSLDIGVSILEGMLCFYSTYNKGGEGNFKLWVMKEYGIKESWTVLFTIQDSNLDSVRPRYRFADGEVLLRCRHLEFPCFIKYTTSRGPFGVCPSEAILKQDVVYTESLISPKLFTYV